MKDVDTLYNIVEYRRYQQKKVTHTFLTEGVMWLCSNVSDMNFIQVYIFTRLIPIEFEEQKVCEQVVNYRDDPICAETTSSKIRSVHLYDRGRDIVQLQFCGNRNLSSNRP